MMKKIMKTIGITLSLVAALLLGSCYEDKGNYDYIELNDVQIDASDESIQEAYIVSRYERLSIPTKVYLNDEPADESSPLEYTWTIYTAHTGVGVTYLTDTLSHEPALDAEITQAPGSYYVQLAVTDKHTGIEHFWRVSCTVEGNMPIGGWMVMYECADRPGTSDFGVVMNPFVKKNVTTEKQFWNLYRASNGAPIEGAPKKIFRPIISMGTGDCPIIAYTDKAFVGVNMETFEKILDQNDWFYEAPAVCNVNYYGGISQGMGTEVIINDNQIYTRNSGKTNFFGVPKTGDYGELADWSSEWHRTNFYNAVVYDQTNQCFVCVPYGSIEVTPFAAQDPTAKFDVNNVGMKLLMGDWGRNDYNYLLMGKGSERYIAAANFFSANSLATNVGVGLYNVSQSPDIAQATSMSAAYLGEYVLYGAGSKVYNLPYSSTGVGSEIWSAPSASEQVTCVRLQKYYFQTLFMMMLPNANTVVHIATWNESTQEGKLYQYNINPASGQLMGEPYVYSVPGKVKEMGWRWAMER